LNAYVAMRPRIEAERLLDLHETLVAAGGRGMKNGQVNTWIRQLRDRAAGPTRRRGVILPRERARATLASAGIALAKRSSVRQAND
jgi:hypothetical protein